MLEKLFYGAALGYMAAVSGCFPHDLILEAPRAGSEIVGSLPDVLANPYNIPAWIKILGAVAGLVAAGVGGKAAVSKVRKKFGKN